MPAHHAKTPLLVVANARHSPSYGCALRLDQGRFRAPLGHARKTLALCRHTWWVSTLMHEGGRLAARLLLAALVVGALVVSELRTTGDVQADAYVTVKPFAKLATHPSRGQRWRWLDVMLLCLLPVPAMKQFSRAPWPWDLAEFGGVARSVSHGQFDVAAGGGGDCFPSDHAVAAFGFFGLDFLWRRHSAHRTPVWLVLVLAAGLLFGGAQRARSAHYPSHTLWSAWLCGALCVAADALFR